MNNFTNKFKQVFAAVALVFLSLSVTMPVVAATIPVSVATFQTSLQASITATATSMTLVSGTNAAGDALSGYTCFNIDEGTSIAEFVCGQASGTAITSMIRGIDPVDGDLEVTALKKAHRRGASVKITNYPALGILSRILNGNEQIPGAITYASGVTPTASGDLTDKEYVLSVVAGGTVSFEKVVVAGTAGETISSGNFVYLKSSDSRWWKTSASAAATSENVIIGIAQGSGTAGNAISNGILVQGIDATQSGLSANTVYYLSTSSGVISSTPGTKEVTAGVALSSSSFLLAPRYDQQITEDEQDALSGGSTFGTPSSSNKFITQDYNKSATGLPVVYTYTTAATNRGSSSTQFDVTLVSGTTYRYTWDSTGTDPSISSGTMPVGSVVYISGSNLAAGNRGIFAVTASATNSFDVTNAAGVAETNKTLGTGFLLTASAANGSYTKPSNLKYIDLEIISAGGGGAGGTSNTKGGTGGGGGGYLRKRIPAASLAATEYFIVGPFGAAGGSNASGTDGKPSIFTLSLVCTGGIGGTAVGAPGLGGTCTGGDLNVPGMAGGTGGTDNSGGGSSPTQFSGFGGNSMFGAGGILRNTSGAGADGLGYGAGGGGGFDTGSAGGNGTSGIIIVTEQYS